jgi:hypothetical protein
MHVTIIHSLMSCVQLNNVLHSLVSRHPSKTKSEPRIGDPATIVLINDRRQRYKSPSPSDGAQIFVSSIAEIFQVQLHHLDSKTSSTSFLLPTIW